MRAGFFIISALPLHKVEHPASGPRQPGIAASHLPHAGRLLRAHESSATFFVLRNEMKEEAKEEGSGRRARKESK